MPIHDFRSQRLFLDVDFVAGAEIGCSRDHANYLRNVMRVKAGEEILVFNGRDGEWRAQIEPRGKRDCNLVIVGKFREQVPGPDILYLFAPLKRARLDYMVQKATELGVSALQPVMTARTVVNRVNSDRMRANAIEAAEQCGVLRVPSVEEPRNLTDVLDDWSVDRTLFFADEAATASAAASSFATVERGSPVAVLIGPEGGFSDDERCRIRALAQTKTVSLGPHIMRADTAAVALLTLVNTFVGDWAD